MAHPSLRSKHTTGTLAATAIASLVVGYLFADARADRYTSEIMTGSTYLQTDGRSGDVRVCTVHQGQGGAGEWQKVCQGWK